ncbi:olfactory receptor 10A7-like [Gopherus flavomarginatus]|uniref:olfactory receptor 10A7-like n=1 Tax=Gopherus flavomarginatus TaxID=286002 RepID=UPI0021CC142E|nr:olfactory receptor 10A7-like [Gopherus flavomarginatus]
MADTEQGNQTSLTEFIFLGFETVPKLESLLFLVSFVIYIVTMAGNILIVVLVVTDQYLHTPMYFFLGNLSCLEICYTSTILSRTLASFLTGDKTISVGGCITQCYFVGFFAGTECYLLAAICKPLHYATLRNGSFYLQLAAGSWISALLASSIVTGMMVQLTFCGQNEIDHFFCESIQLINLYRNSIY